MGVMFKFHVVFYSKLCIDYKNNTLKQVDTDEIEFRHYLFLIYFSRVICGIGVPYLVNPLYTGGLFQCYMLDESIGHFRDAGSILSL